jgi:tetratricopeptide (TPR) repeat protein
MLAQLELETKQQIIEEEKRLQAERDSKAKEERVAQQKKIEAEKELQRQELLARQQAEAKRQAELQRKQVEKQRLAELKRKEAEERRMAALERQEAEKNRQAELERKAEEERKRAELERQEAERQNQILSQLSIADLYFDNGDYTEAQKQYQKVLAMNPDEMENQRAMQRMENTNTALLVLKRSDLILLFHDVRGTYRSDISTAGMGNPRFALGRRPKIEVELKQNKDKITGTFSGSSSGDIEGIMSEDAISFKWFVTDGPAGSVSGIGEWKVTNHGLNLNGTWDSP